MSFDSSSDLDAFVIFIFESADTEKVVARYIMNSIEPSDFSHRALNVQPFTRYLIKLRLCVGGICSLFSDSVFIRTMEGKSSRVRNVKITEKADKVHVTWSVPRNISGILRKYSLNVMDMENVTLPGYPVIVQNTSLSHFLTNLPANQKLLFQIIPYTTSEGESYSTWFVSPEGLPGVPNAVSAITTNNDKRVAIRWQQPDTSNGKILGYMVSSRCVFVYVCLHSKSNITFCVDSKKLIFSLTVAVNPRFLEKI